MNRVIEVKDEITSEREFIKQTETVSSDAAEKSATLNIFGKAAQSVAPITYGKAKSFRKYLSGEEVPTVGDIVLSAAKGILNYVFPKTSEKFGYRVFGKYWVPKTYAEVKEDVLNYVSGAPALEHVAEYGDVVFDGEKVLAKQDGVSAHYTKDPEKALGKSVYRWLQARTGSSKEKLDEAVKTYFLSHEEGEAGHQRRTGKGRLDESEHGKIQAYVLKSLKELGEYDAYKVGALIDSKRIGAFGHYINKHATEDVRLDLQRALAVA